MDVTPYQPVITFSDGVTVAFSTVADGSVSVGGGAAPTAENISNATSFIQKMGLSLPTTKIHVTYGSERTYTDCYRVTASNKGASIKSDALYTTEPGVTLTLPVADCIATVVYDPAARLLGVLHLGRHASVAGLIEHFAEEVTRETASQPENWQVWMSPSVRQAHDRMDYFEPPKPEQWADFQRGGPDGIYIDTAGHNRHRFELFGVKSENISLSDIDTYGDTRYFSHRAAVEQNDLSREGRMMLAAMIN